MLQKNRNLASLLILFSLLFLQIGCTSKHETVEFVKCKMCGMNAAISRGKFILYYPDGEVYHTCSGHCAALIVANKKAEPDKTEAYAYDLDKMINIKEAFFVVGADIIPENSMYPSVFSFSDENKALDFQKSHGGKLTDFNGVMETGRKKD